MDEGSSSMECALMVDAGADEIARFIALLREAGRNVTKRLRRSGEV